MSTQFLIGADPEVFLRDKKTKQIISAHNVIPGTKAAPFPVERGAIQVDGMALEFNIDPVDSRDFGAFERNVTGVMKSLKDYIPKSTTLEIVSDTMFDLEYLESQPLEAKELGCNPDFNAYTMGQNNPPDGSSGLRTAAGHIHVGWGADIPVDSSEHFEICAGFIKHMDVVCGFISVLLDPDSKRRALYGRAGAFRPKPYGVEYRTPSNAWLKNQTTRKLMFDAISQSLFAAQNQKKFHLSEEQIQEYINESRVEEIISYFERTYSYGSVHNNTIRYYRAQQLKKAA